MSVAVGLDMAVRHHRDLVCWQLSSEFRRQVYAETAEHNWNRDWKFRDDLRRASRSVPANIAEGFWRYHHGDFARFISIALGSLGESEDHLEAAELAGLMDPARHAELKCLAHRARVAMQRLRTYLLQTATTSRRSTGRT